MTGTPIPTRLRAYLSAPGLAQVWAAARSRLERNGLHPTGTLTLDLDDAAADRLSGLLGRPLEPGVGRRIKLAELDAALRRSAAGQGLISVLEALDGRPLTDRAATRQDARAQWAQVWQRLDAAMRALGHAVAALEILLPPTAEPPASWELAALATRITGNAHGFDDTSLASAVLLRAAAHAFGRRSEESAADRRELW